MKHTRKLMALLLALVVVLSLSVTAFATDETGTITVDNPVTGQDYTAYKIFDVVYNADKDAYAYTIDSSSKWFATVQAYATDANKLTLTQVNGTSTYVVTTESGFGAASFANTLKAKVVGEHADATIVATGRPLTLSDGKATASGLPLGYYFVSSTSGALCNLTTTNPTVTIHDKNDMPFDKTDDKETGSVEIGEKVTFTLTGKVPDTTGFETYTYKITDTMSSGLTFNKDVAVKIGETDVTADCTLTYTPNNTNTTGFELTIPVKDYQAQIGAAITVTYSAIINENAVTVTQTNTATLEYSNDPTDATIKKEITDHEDVFTAKIVIDKYAVNSGNADDHSKKLAGAKFVLYKEEGGKKLYYKYTAATATVAAKVDWVESKTDATEVTTGSDGAANFLGLKNGTYKLEETAAPAGYNKLAEPVTITVNGAAATPASLTHTEAVGNNTGAMLPATGGMGTTLFYVVGSILLLGAAVLLITKKRMSAAK